MEAYVLIVQLMRGTEPVEIPVNNCPVAMREWTIAARQWANRAGVEHSESATCFRADMPPPLAWRVKR